MRVCPVLGLLTLLAGCATDDFSRPGTWQPAGLNDANLRVMLAEPAHAYRGATAETERGQPASTAIRRLERGLRRPLPDTRVSRIGATGAETRTTGGADAR